mmetsp:Transcript_5709/g.20693  ORF Transcript_5709/g.20693 Transcript_5709/m.20693 type:complete len:213 (+) Transcript_5709:907-1545(+)
MIFQSAWGRRAAAFLPPLYICLVSFNTWRTMTISATKMAIIPALTGTDSVRNKIATLLSFKSSCKYACALPPTSGMAYSPRKTFENHTAWKKDRDLNFLWSLRANATSASNERSLLSYSYNFPCLNNAMVGYPFTPMRFTNNRFFGPSIFPTYTSPSNSRATSFHVVVIARQCLHHSAYTLTSTGAPLPTYSSKFTSPRSTTSPSGPCASYS